MYVDINLPILQNVEWRKTNCIDDIESWDPPEVLKKYGVGGIVGFDKAGCPVWLDKAPLFDWRGTSKHTAESNCILISPFCNVRNTWMVFNPVCLQLLIAYRQLVHRSSIWSSNSQILAYNRLIGDPIYLLGGCMLE